VEDEQEQRRERAYQSGAGCPGTGGWTTPRSSSRRRSGSGSGPQAQVQGTGRKNAATGWRRREYISPSVSGGPTGLFGGAATVRRHQKEGRGREPKANSFWLVEACGRLQPWGALGTSRLHRTLCFFSSSRLQGTRVKEGQEVKYQNRPRRGGKGRWTAFATQSVCALQTERSARMQRTATRAGNVAGMAL